MTTPAVLPTSSTRTHQHSPATKQSREGDSSGDTSGSTPAALLRARGLEIVGNIGPVKQKHTIRCLVCGTTHTCTLLSRTQGAEKHRQGCGKCTLEQKQAYFGSAYIATPRDVNRHNKRVAPVVVKQPRVVVAPVVKSKATSNTKVIQDLIDKSNVVPVNPDGDYLGFRVRQQFRCVNDGCTTVFESTPQIISQTTKRYAARNTATDVSNACPTCRDTRNVLRTTDTYSPNVDTIVGRGYEILDGDYQGQLGGTKQLRVKRTECGHEFTTAGHRLLRKTTTCPVCNVVEKTKRLGEGAQARKQLWLQTATAWSAYRSAVTAATAVTYAQYIDIINPAGMSRGLAGTPDSYQLDHIVPVRFCFDYDVPVERCASLANLQMLPWQDNSSKSDKIARCDLPFEFVEFLGADVLASAFPAESLAEDIQRVSPDVHHVINPKLGLYRVDIAFPDHGIAVRFVDPVQESSHTDHNKNTLANVISTTSAKGYRTLIVYTDEWQQSRELVVQKIRHALGISTGVSVGARKCDIRVIGTSEKDAFLKRYHIQGSDKSSVKIGAYYGTDLVGVMTFGKTRPLFGSGQDADPNEKEMVRFATNTNYRCVGLASKMLKYAQRHCGIMKIVTYADRRWSVGNLYLQLGFTQEGKPTSGYEYVVDGKRHHRWKYTKKALVALYPEYTDLTESQIAAKVGLRKLFNPGNFTFRINLATT